MSASLERSSSTVVHRVTTRDGWTLRLERAAPLGAGRPPVLFVPGYGMNGWIFRWHPAGRTFQQTLLEAGLDPWSVDLRGASSARGSGRVRLADQALIDLPAALDAIREITGFDHVHAIGCSLGGSLLYGHAAQSDHGLDRLVGIGAPLSWARDARSRLLSRVLPTGGRVPMRGSRAAASLALPIAARIAPWALRIYLNPAITDVRGARRLVKTVEDPIPSINRAIGAWMKAGDLHLDGLDVGAALRGFERPLLVIHGSGDGIVPDSASLSVVGRTGGDVEVTRVADEDGHPVGHADLFASRVAPVQVFDRVAAFLTE